MLDKGSGGLTYQCGEDALVRVLPDAVAAGQEQTAPSHLDTAVSVDISSEIGDPPGPAAGMTPLTMFSLTFGNVPSAFIVPAPFDAGMTPMPPSNLARKSRSSAH